MTKVVINLLSVKLIIISGRSDVFTDEGEGVDGEEKGGQRIDGRDNLVDVFRAVDQSDDEAHLLQYSFLYFRHSSSSSRSGSYCLTG